MGKPTRDKQCDDSDGDGRDSDSSSSVIRTRDRKSRKRRRRESKKETSTSKKRSHRKEHPRRCDENEDDNSYSSVPSSTHSYDDESSSSHHRKRKKKSKKKKEKKKKKSKRSKSKGATRKSRDSDSDEEGQTRNGKHQINYDLANKLLHLLTNHPGMSEQLPILLIRLCSGSTFSLQHSQVREPLEQVLRCLEPFGVYRLPNEAQTFAWKPSASHNNDSNDAANSSATPHPELALVRKVRLLLDEIGLTALAVTEHEQQGSRQHSANSRSKDPPPTASAAVTNVGDSLSNDIAQMVQRILHSFPGVEKQLMTISQTLLKGNAVSLETVSDKQVREALSRLFDICQLKKSAGKVEGGNNILMPDETSVKYALPENKNSSNAAIENIRNVLQACETKTARVLGPMGPPANYNPHQNDSDDEDDEGPRLTPNDEPLRKLTKEELDAHRIRLAQLERVKAGLDPALASAKPNGREEWMLVPGQHDFLDAVKAAPSNIRNRQFQNIKSDKGGGHGGDAKNDDAIDPQIQSEMDRLMTAHQESRGPSLMDEHQAAKEEERRRMQEEMQAGGNNKKGASWKWNRSQDLDAGRRVDKDALQAVMGGAADGLKTKFQGGFRANR